MTCRLTSLFAALAVTLAAGHAFAQSAFVSVTASKGIDASSYNPDSFVVANTSTNGVHIESFRLNLSTAIFPDMVYDPDGTAGDRAAKCFEADTGAAAVGLVAPADPCTSPFSGPHDDGYYVLELSFTDFDPGETFQFSIDADPTSIRGTSGNGGGSSGSVSGLELTGATVTVEFDGSQTRTGELFRQPGSNGGAQNTIRNGAPAAPAIQALGISSPSSTADATQTIRISGPAGESVRLLRVEGMLDLNGGNGFDIDPFEANRAVVVAEQSATIGAGGSVDVNVTLSRASDDAGFNYLTAVVVDDDGSGRTGQTSNVVVLRLTEDAECATNADCGDGNPCTTDTCNGGSCSNANNSAACNDGIFCNGDDTCSGGTCSDHDGNPCSGGPQCADTCNEAADFCDDPAGTACSGDGNPCTDDECDGNGACVHPANDAPCDDGLFCNGDDSCSAGNCSVHDGDPCSGGPQCADTCNESSDSCNDPAGAACSGDLNPCTDDECDGDGECVHPPNDDACDDGDACTTGDRCQDGLCVGTTAVQCDDGAACNGEETCDSGLGCLSGEPIACSEAAPCFTNPRCEDGACRADPLCDEECETCAGEGECLSLCGHPVSDASGPVVATDALAALTAAVAGSGCSACVCDVDGSGAVVATDALLLLSRVVNGDVSIDCSAAVEPPGASSASTTTTIP